LPENYRTAKRLLREEYNPKVLELNDQILDIKQEIGNLKVTLVQTGVDVGPAIYLARVFGTDIDTVVKFFIFILIFVFDPMALAMVLAFNTAVGRKTFTEKEFKEPIRKQNKPKQISNLKMEKIEEPVAKEIKKMGPKKGGISATGHG